MVTMQHIVPNLSDEFWEKLTQYLSCLPTVREDKDRDLSWRSAAEIFEWWKTWSNPTMDADILNSALIDEWRRQKGASAIRFAKYPRRGILTMLWGHKSRVGNGDPDLNEKVLTHPLEFERILVSKNAPQIFLSHSFLDLHFASRIRFELLRNNLRPWMAEEKMTKGSILIEEVRKAVEGSAMVVGVITRHSLTSAWFDTEIYSSQYLGKPVILTWDSTDELLMSILSRWHPQDSYQLSSLDKEELNQLKQEVEGYISASRAEKYLKNSEQFLLGLEGWDCSNTIYPRRPNWWKGDKVILDFEKVLSDFKGQLRTGVRKKKDSAGNSDWM